MGRPFLHCHHRFKNGKDHCYWSIAEKVRTHRGWVQRHLLYLGEVNDSQRAAWTKVIEVFDTTGQRTRELALYPADRAVPEHAASYGVQVRLEEFQLRRPRQWGACWVGCQLWDQLQLEEFWRQRLPDSREGTSWRHVLQTLTIYRLIDPGSEWRLHREWFKHSAMADLLGEDFSLAQKDKLYRCLDRLLEHRDALFRHLRCRWEDLFGVKFEVVLYDLTSTYFESDPPFGEGDKRQYGYSRDKRPDCVQVVIGLVVTPEGFPLAYEVMAGNTSDRTTLRAFLQRIETLYGKAQRIWLMDRGIPTEEVLAEMRASDPPIHYLVGTPKGRLTQYEQQLLERPWQVVRQGVQVKLLPQEQELYVLAQSQDRVNKERAMRRRQLKGLVKRLKALQAMELSRDKLLLKLGAAKSQFPAAWRLVALEVPKEGEPLAAPNFTFELRTDKLRQVRRREGRYLLRSNLGAEDPGRLWQFYILLTQVEAAFKDFKDDLSLRPIFHQLERRIEAHIFVAFLAYCLHVQLRARLRPLAPGLTPRSVLEKFAAIQMLDVHFPTSDQRELVFCRYTQPEKDHKMILAQLGWELPPQSPPRITQKGQLLQE
ncbi:MAG TPA: IS1634 family transposase [Verrucomicrobiota bacterium]|mgnify:CR=1 FL=1|jgi:transposase|nr:IS1634 family transposase [Verrucomicrobiota bacterium]